MDACHSSAAPISNEKATSLIRSDEIFQHAFTPTSVPVKLPSTLERESCKIDGNEQITEQIASETCEPKSRHATEPLLPEVEGVPAEIAAFERANYIIPQYNTGGNASVEHEQLQQVAGATPMQQAAEKPTPSDQSQSRRITTVASSHIEEGNLEPVPILGKRCNSSSESATKATHAHVDPVLPQHDGELGVETNQTQEQPRSSDKIFEGDAEWQPQHESWRSCRRHGRTVAEYVNETFATLDLRSSEQHLQVEPRVRRTGSVSEG